MYKLLTISVAAYNVEKYLEQTLSSLNDQRFLDDIEVLIVDDGSKDGTKDIALKYQNIAPDTFKYVKKENGGHGSTINKGIELASGKYFRVIDGDDWVDQDGFAKYIKLLKRTKADLILTQHKTNCAGKESLQDLVHGMENEKLYHWFEDLNIEGITLHMTTIKTALLQSNSIRITEKCYYVDIEFIIWSIYLSETISYFDIPVYIYRIGNASQSINKKNMVKNIAMQEKVACNECKMYSSFLAEKKLEYSKNKMIYKCVAQSIGGTFRTYLLLDNNSESKRKIIEFDNKIKNISPEIFEMLKKQKFIRFMRFGNYIFIPLLRILYRIWILRY